MYKTLHGGFRNLYLRDLLMLTFLLPPFLVTRSTRKQALSTLQEVHGGRSAQPRSTYGRSHKKYSAPMRSPRSTCLPGAHRNNYYFLYCYSYPVLGVLRDACFTCAVY